MEYLWHWIKYVSKVQPDQIRNSDNFLLGQANIVAMQKSLFCNGLQVFYAEDIKKEKNFNVEEKSVRKNFVKNEGN